jgi:leader peptidase (prepilin peptidase)/N-methyltransferase
MMTAVFIFILGLFIGSFLNVVIYRLHRQESFVKGYSKCLFCNHRLYTQDLVPLFSYLFLRGRCRYCQQRFSKQYPLVELATGLVFFLSFYYLFPDLSLVGLTWSTGFQLLYFWAIGSFLLIIFVYDLKYYLILDKVILPAVILACLGSLLSGHGLFNILLAALVGGGFFLLQFVLSRGRWIGGGDIRLGVLLGILLGWPQVLVALFLAYVVGSLIAVGLLLVNKKKWGDKIPFGTFLSLAAWLVLLYGQTIIDWYWGLFNLGK